MVELVAVGVVAEIVDSVCYRLLGDLRLLGLQPTGFHPQRWKGPYHQVHGLPVRWRVHLQRPALVRRLEVVRVLSVRW